MARERLEIIIDDRGTQKKYSKDSDRAARSTNNLVKSAIRLGAAYFGTRGVINALKFSITAAGDAQETISKFEAVFKTQAKEARAFADELASSTNRASIDLIDFLATLQDTFVPLGFARDAASDLSQSLVTLAVDVASFNNKVDADVIRDFQSALVGNTETVRKYGIVITQARLQQELINSGLADSVKDATEAEKAQARYNLILSGTTDAQGDAIRTSSSYANTVKGLESATKDLAIAFGTELLPTLTPVVAAFASLARSAAAYIKELNKLPPVIDEFTERHTALVLSLVEGRITTELYIAAIEGLNREQLRAQAIIAANTEVIDEQLRAVGNLDLRIKTLTTDYKPLLGNVDDTKTALDEQAAAASRALGAMSSLAGLLKGGANDAAKIFLGTMQILLTTMEAIAALKAIGGIGGFFSTVGSLLGFAGGGTSPGGPILVGERGPEILSPPAGTQIINNNTTQQILGSQRPIIIQIAGHTVAEILAPDLERGSELGQNNIALT